MSQPGEQKIVFFDEFAVYDRPSLFYAWAEKNSRPEIPSNERCRNKVNGLLAVDVKTGKEYLRLTSRAKSEDIANYFLSLVWECIQQGKTEILIILDNNSTHKKKMKNLLAGLLNKAKISEKIKVLFLHTPPYSPDFNLVEYIIHQLRLKVLHHQPEGMNIKEVENKLKNYLQFNQLQTPCQINKTIYHICSLVTSMK